jgi:hypothetical protein
MNRIHEIIPDGANVLAEATWWFELGPHANSFLDDAYVALLSDSGQFERSPEFLASQFAQFDIDYVIVDGYLGCNSTHSLNGDYVIQYIESTCELVGVVDALSISGNGSSSSNKVYFCGLGTP